VSFASAVASADAQAEAEGSTEGQWAAWRSWTDAGARICYETLTRESVLPEASSTQAGGGLCARCRTAWYSTREAQRAHWHIHKRVCAPPNLSKVGTMDSHECLRALSTAFRGKTFSADMAAILHRLGVLLKSLQAEDAGEIGMAIHTLGRNVAARYDAETWAELWAVPGMPHTLLTEPLLRASLVRRERIVAAVGREPTMDETFEHGLDGYGDQGAYEYCFLLFNLLCGAGFVPGGALSASSAHDGRGAARRDSALGRAAYERAFTLWLDPRVRESCGDALGPAASYALRSYPPPSPRSPSPPRSPPCAFTRAPSLSVAGTRRHASRRCRLKSVR
jgi:hypothetical protein